MVNDRGGENLKGRLPSRANRTRSTRAAAPDVCEARAAITIFETLRPRFIATAPRFTGASLTIRCSQLAASAPQRSAAGRCTLETRRASCEDWSGHRYRPKSKRNGVALDTDVDRCGAFLQGLAHTQLTDKLVRGHECGIARLSHATSGLSPQRRYHRRQRKHTIASICMPSVCAARHPRFRIKTLPTRK